MLVDLGVHFLVDYSSGSAQTLLGIETRWTIFLRFEDRIYKWFLSLLILTYWTQMDYNVYIVCNERPDGLKYPSAMGKLSNGLTRCDCCACSCTANGDVASQRNAKIDSSHPTAIK